MSNRDTKGKGKKEAEADVPSSFAETCSRMISHEMPGCCGPAMGKMLSLCMAESQPEEEKQQGLEQEKE